MGNSDVATPEIDGIFDGGVTCLLRVEGLDKDAISLGKVDLKLVA